MKTLSILFLVLAGYAGAYAQGNHANTYSCTNGKIHFFSSTPIEDINATSNGAVCVFNTETKKIYAKVKMTSFEFPKKLMQEHFNENYMESDQYPNGELVAEIVEAIDFTKDGTYDVTLKGTFEVHGVKVNRQIKGKLTVKGGAPVSASANFDVKLVDHKIDIPKAVVANIAEVISVDVAFTFVKYKD